MLDKSSLMVIADNSGSMGEAAKPFILKDMLSFINESLKLGSSLSFSKAEFYCVNAQIKLLNVNSKDSLDNIKFNEKFNIEEVIKLLKKNSNNIERVLILSDWKLSMNEKNIFFNFAKKQNMYSIRVVLIEIGLSIDDVNKINSKIFYHPQDIQKALNA